MSPTAEPHIERALRAIHLALEEDAFEGDVTSRALVPADARGRAVLRAKEAGVCAGAGFAALTFTAAGADGDERTRDGHRVRPGRVLLQAKGPLRALLAAERTAVNIVQRMSGIATTTARYVEAVRGTRARILATRKTAPALREFDLAAVRAGGGDVHRRSLADRVLVKRNHLLAARAAGSATTMADAVALVRRRCRVPIGIEATDLRELRAALVRGVEVVLLDNFEPAGVAEAVRIRDAEFPAGDGPELEASGGITLANVRDYAETGVERISVGAITHSAPALDVSMKIVPA